MAVYKLIELPKGFLKSFNDFNQDAKTIYDKYFIYPNGIIISDKSYKYTIGGHFCKTNFSLSKIDNVFDNLVIEFDSDIIYRTIKDNKKGIKYIRIDDDNTIHLTGETSTEFGTAIDLDITIGYWHDYYATEFESPIMDKLSNTFNLATTCINEKLPNTITISDEDVEDLVKNHYKNYNLGKYSTRITREIIPGLKKSHELTISFYDNDKDDRLFNIRLIATRSSLTSYHNYTCIFM